MAGDLEQWLPCVGIPDYEVSDLGRVRSNRRANIYRRGQARLMTPTMSGLRKDGRRQRYLQVCVQRDGKAVTLKVHHLVMDAFVGPRMSGIQVNHKDGDPHNNRLSNLEYVTGADNMRHAVDSGLQPIHRGESHYKAKFTDNDIREIRRSLSAGESTLTELGRKYGVDKTVVWSIKQRKSWKHVV